MAATAQLLAIARPYPIPASSLAEDKAPRRVVAPVELAAPAVERVRSDAHTEPGTARASHAVAAPDDIDAEPLAPMYYI